MIFSRESISISISLKEDNPNKYVSIETQICNELSEDYINIAVGSNDGLSATVAHKSKETESECYQLVDLLRETTDLLKVGIKDKRATINNLINIIKISH